MTFQPWEWVFVLAKVLLSFLFLFVSRRYKNKIVNLLENTISKFQLLEPYRRKIKNIFVFLYSSYTRLLAIAFVLLFNDYESLLGFSAFGDFIAFALEVLNKLLLVFLVFKGIALATTITEDYFNSVSNNWDLEPHELKSFKTMLPLGVGLLKNLLNVINILFLITVFGVDISPFLNFGLVVTGVLGYALQPLIQDYVGLFKIISESLYEEGDLVLLCAPDGEIEEQYVRGKVLKITPTFTFILTDNGNTTAFANKLVDCVHKIKEENTPLSVK